jgi:hypothetical protein
MNHHDARMVLAIIMFLSFYSALMGLNIYFVEKKAGHNDIGSVKFVIIEACIFILACILYNQEVKLKQICMEKQKMSNDWMPIERNEKGLITRKSAEDMYKAGHVILTDEEGINTTMDVCPDYSFISETALKNGDTKYSGYTHWKPRFNGIRSASTNPLTTEVNWYPINRDKEGRILNFCRLNMFKEKYVFLFNSETSEPEMLDVKADDIVIPSHFTHWASVPHVENRPKDEHVAPHSSDFESVEKEDTI